METSDILSRIRARYPTRLYLTYVGGKSLCLHYPAELAREQELRGAIAQLPLDMRQDPCDADLELWLSLEPCQGEREPVLCLRCGEDCFYFPGPEPENGVMWTLYALAMELPFLRGKSPAKLRTVTYSADQQALAARLLKSADYWQRTLAAETLPPLLEKAVTAGVKGMLSRAPRFSERPYTASGRELLARSQRLLPPSAQQTRCGELAARLWGEEPFEQDLDAWCAMMKRRPAFAAALKQAEAQVCGELFRMPMMESVVRVRDAVQELSQHFDVKEEQRRVSAELDAPLDFKRLPPEEIRRLFVELDRAYESMARKKIAAALLEPLAQKLKKRVEDAIPSALAALRDWNRSLRGFCRVNGHEERLNIGWDCCGELRDEDLLVVENGWSDAMLRDLNTRSGVVDGYYLACWFCSSGIYTRTREYNEQMSSEMAPIPGMTEHLIVALMQKPILEE